MTAYLPPVALYPDLEVRTRRGWLLGVGVALSVLLHLVVLAVLHKWIPIRQSMTEQGGLQIQIRAEVSPVMESPAPEPKIEEQQEVEELPPPVATPPSVEKVPDPPPPRKSVLQMVDEYRVTEDLPGAPPEDIGLGNVFHPDLRRATGGPQRPSGGNPLLNNSTLSDTQERVALDGKCFRLEDLGGGGDRRAWYRVTCKGNETTSDAMARGLMEALERRR